MVTSRAVVGSSAMSSFGLTGQGHCNHDPLTHPARELVWVPSEHCLWVGNANELDEVQGPLDCLTPVATKVLGRASLICHPTLNIGWRERIGS